MEQFDILDASGKKKGYTRPRAQSLKEGEFALVAKVMVKNKENKLLLMYRDPRKHSGGRWEIPGGGVQAGEESLDAIQRELSEETGIRLPPESFRFVRRTLHGRFFFDLYEAECDIQLEKIRFQEGETTDAIYVSGDEFVTLCKQDKVTGSLRTTLYKNIMIFLEEHSL